MDRESSDFFQKQFQQIDLRFAFFIVEKADSLLKNRKGRLLGSMRNKRRRDKDIVWLCEMFCNRIGLGEFQQRVFITIVKNLKNV